MKMISASRRTARLHTGGYIFLLILTLNFFAALNTGLNLLYIVFGGVASFSGLSLLLAFWTLRRVRAGCEAPYAVHRGDTFLTSIRIENPKRFMPAISVRVESDNRPGETAGYVLKISARHAAQLTIDDCFQQRGVHPLPPCSLVTTFPFGLMELRSTFQSAEEVIVFPRVTPVRTSPIEQMPGPACIPRGTSGDGDEYYAIREYQPGDEIRHIAWRISARLGKWMVREFSLEQSRSVLIAFDTRAVYEIDHFNDHFEEAVDFTASLAISLLQRLYSVAIVTPDRYLASGSGSGQQRKVLEMLARVMLLEPSEYAGFEERIDLLHSPEIRLVHITPDPRQWGRPWADGQFTINPGDLMHV